MRLDRLEVSGFKSFPDRADVAFDAGVTAIVGPNGCGKSNLVDAITWVLGEQSARSLRGERMEDVIFSGSDARKATAAAEVRLRLTGVPSEAARLAATRRDSHEAPAALIADDAGQPEPRQVDLPAIESRHVEIARRLYRSGESEYLIDGEGCRLRDVQDLLMDAGVGVKGYAVIEQGKIGQILSAKPTERRQLIEEAAGVTKYKSRRRAAELKLEAAQQNLTRIDDIVFELEKQRTALKRQAAKARRYKRLREELRRWERVLFARRYRALAQQMEAADQRLDQARARERRAASEVGDIESQLSLARVALAGAEERLRGVRERIHARELDNDRREQQLTFNRQQIETLGEAVERLTAERDALAARREPARVELEERREAWRRAEDERTEAADVLVEADRSAAGHQQALEVVEREVEDTRGRLFSSQNTVVTLQYAIERAQDGRRRLRDVIERLDAEASDARIDVERLRAEERDVTARLAGAREAIAVSRATRARHEASLFALRDERQRQMDALRASEREHAAAAARLRSLEELDAHREGYGDAARLVLADTASGVTHQGSVADYLDADPEHERLVEALAGRLLPCVVVDTLADAEQGLAYVRAQNAGRVGFLIADGHARTAHAPADARATPLSAIVRVSGPCQDAILAALSNMWIATSPDTARACSLEVSGLVATPNGDVYRDGCLVFGGARSEARGILATKREIKELRTRLHSDRASLEWLAGKLQSLDLEAIETDRLLGVLAAEVHDHEKVIVALELQSERLATELDRLGRKREQIATERRQAEEEHQGLDLREDEARQSIGRLEAERGVWQEALAEAQRRMGEAREATSDAMRRAAEAKARHAALVERATGAQNDVRRLEAAGHELEERIAQRAEEGRQADQRRAQLEQAIADGERSRAEDAIALAALRDEMGGLASDAHAEQQQTDAHEQAARDARLALDGIRSELSQAEIVRATTESDLQHLAAACLDTLQATLDEVAAAVDASEQGGTPAPPDTFDDETDLDDESEANVAGHAAAEEAAATALTSQATTAEEVIAGLRAKIDRLGPVNMMAIEQFDELETRHAFLTTQRQDLIDAIASTGEAIRRIDKTTRERFGEAFSAINRYFEEMFTTLFGGGRAGLVLLDETDLLESGIDIIAQPPGKRLQNVQLLSGGEKALTAMALMFGIFRDRPSPFCLLDEIDAPLDDANIGRFIEMLRGMQENTQFILVTHHRRTMEIADRLYGVTMEEPGVSKLISLRLN